MMNKNVNYKRTEGIGYYENKEDKDHKVIVYDITHCVDDENTYYSYTDPMFDIRRLSTTKDKFLDKFVFIRGLNNYDLQKNGDYHFYGYNKSVYIKPPKK